MPHPLLAGARGRRRTPSARTGTLFERFVAGQIACMRELTLFFAPQVNSYKRFAEGSFAPTAVAWGEDNRTCSLRSVGHGPSLRIENRLPGADVNPYLALSRDDRRRACTASRTSWSSSRRSRATPTPATPRACPTTCMRRPRAVRRQRGGPRRLRPGGGGPLPQPRRRGAGRVRVGRDGLGEVPGLREALMGVAIGICSAVERVRWGAWEETVTMAPRSYAHRGAGGGRDRAAPAPRRRRGRGSRRAAGPHRRADAGRRLRRGPRLLRRPPAPRDQGHVARARPLRAGPGAPRAGARHARAGHLPRDADAQRGRAAAHSSSTCPTSLGTRTTATPRAPTATTRCGWSPARWPPGRPRPSGWRSSRTTTRDPRSWATA